MFVILYDGRDGASDSGGYGGGDNVDDGGTGGCELIGFNVNQCTVY